MTSEQLEARRAERHRLNPLKYFELATIGKGLGILFLAACSYWASCISESWKRRELDLAWRAYADSLATALRAEQARDRDTVFIVLSKHGRRLVRLEKARWARKAPPAPTDLDFIGPPEVQHTRKGKGGVFGWIRDLFSTKEGE